MWVPGVVRLMTATCDSVSMLIDQSKISSIERPTPFRRTLSALANPDPVTRSLSVCLQGLWWALTVTDEKLTSRDLTHGVPPPALKTHTESFRLRLQEKVCGQLVGRHQKRLWLPGKTACDDGVRSEGAWALAPQYPLGSPHRTRSAHALQTLPRPGASAQTIEPRSPSPHRTPAKTPRLSFPGRHLQRSRIAISPRAEISEAP